MPILWDFRCYVSADGRDEIRHWHDTGSRQLRAKFLSRLRMLAQLRFEEWNDPLYKNLHRECAGLGELRFLADRTQQRPLGFRSGAWEFTILFPATEKGGKFVPKNACTIALKRRAEVLADRNKANALWLALE